MVTLTLMMDQIEKMIHYDEHNDWCDCYGVVTS